MTKRKTNHKKRAGTDSEELSFREQMARPALVEWEEEVSRIRIESELDTYTFKLCSFAIGRPEVLRISLRNVPQDGIDIPIGRNPSELERD
jgi:hypothetical protein